METLLSVPSCCPWRLNYLFFPGMTPRILRTLPGPDIRYIRLPDTVRNDILYQVILSGSFVICHVADITDSNSPIKRGRPDIRQWHLPSPVAVRNSYPIFGFIIRLFFSFLWITSCAWEEKGRISGIVVSVYRVTTGPKNNMVKKYNPNSIRNPETNWISGGGLRNSASALS